MGRILVIGDIHGSAKALMQVLERANVTEEDTIIQLGDVADGWSETSECVDILLALNEVNNCIFLRGNHDVWVYDWFKYGRTPLIWTQQGGQATIDSYVKNGSLVDEDHKDFWMNQKDYYIDDSGRLFIHAGWSYADISIAWGDLSPIELFEKQALMSVNAGSIAKECHWDRSIWYGARSGSIIKKSDGKAHGFTPLNLFNEVYIGHTATKSHKPEQRLNLWNLDSGCGWNGKLTIMDVDSKEY